jgi:hypothetical protein
VYLSFNALADYANSHHLPSDGGHLFPHPYGGWAFAVAIDGAVLYAFISFKRAPWLASLLLIAGAAATYTLQRWHAEGALHPLVVAGVVPGAMILVTFAWHRIRAASIPTPLGTPVPDQPDADQPDLDQDRGPGRDRPRVAQDAVRRGVPATRGGPSLPKADQVALDRAAKNGPEAVEAAVARRGLERSLVAARPERWPLPSRNGGGS